MAKKYFLPKSIFVNRRTVADVERGTISNYAVDLEQLIVNTVTTATPPIYTSDNGITQNGLVFELGGGLTQNTVVDGGGSTYDLSFNDMLNLNITGTTTNITSQVNLVTPGIGAASNGYVFTLADSATGEGEWTALPTVAVTDANNGLNVDATVVQLGGSLVENTTISGNTYTFPLVLDELKDFTVDATNITQTSVANITHTAGAQYTLEASSTTFFKIGNYAIEDNEYSVLTLTDNTTGAVKFKPNNSRKIVTVDTATYSADAQTYSVMADCAAAPGTAITVTLLDPAFSEGEMVVIKLISAGTLTINSLAGGSGLFTTAAQVSVSTAVVGDVFRFHCDGTYWQQI